MMVEFKWIKMSLFLIAVLQFPAAAEKLLLSFTVRVRDDVTLPCENVTVDQHKCHSTTWLFIGSTNRGTEELVKLGQIGENTKSDRLSVTANCSLVIKKVTVEDVGQYTCRQFISGQQQGPDSQVDLSVINIDQHQNNDEVILSCSVLTYKKCGHTVKWLYEGDNNNVEISQSSCSARVTFKPPHLNQKSNYHQLLKCNVTDKKSGQMLLCDVGPQSSSEKTGDTQTSTTQSTRTAEDNTAVTTTTATNETSTKLQGSTLEERNKTSSAEDQTTTKQGWWWLIIVFVGVAALLIIVVAVIRWKRTKGKKTQMDENTADPEDGVSYASISYTKKSNSKAWVRGKDDDDDDDEDEAVTYSTVKASSSSAGASADPSDLYATVNNPNK